MAYLMYSSPCRQAFRLFPVFSLTLIKAGVIIILDFRAHMQQFSRHVHRDRLAGPQNLSIFCFTNAVKCSLKWLWQFINLLSLSSMWECHFCSHVLTVQATLGIAQEKSSLTAVPICTSEHPDWLFPRLLVHIFCPFFFFHWVICLFSWICRSSVHIWRAFVCLYYANTLNSSIYSPLYLPNSFTFSFIALFHI